MRKIQVTLSRNSVPFEAVFHAFGFVSEEVANGALIESIAIIELEDGQITTVEVESIQFLDKPGVES